MKPGLKFICFALCIFLTGCFSSKNRLNRAQLLKPGTSEVTYAYSETALKSCDGSVKRQSDDRVYCTQGELESGYFINISRQYRLGMVDTFWVFKGLDFGYQLEVPNTTEFDFRVGLPTGGLKDLKHTLSIGWAWGTFADNTYFAEYAIAFQAHKKLLPFANFRYTSAATPFRDQKNEDYSNKWLIMEASMGVSLDLPEITIVPDRLQFTIHGSFPNINQGDVTLFKDQGGSALFYYSLGMGWNY